MKLAPLTDTIKNHVLFIITLIALILGLELLVEPLKIPSYIIPKPSLVFKTLLDPSLPWAYASYVTVGEALIGFGIAALVGIALAMIMLYSSTLANAIWPYILILNVVPKSAFAPLFVLWFGFGWGPKIVLAFILSVFVIIVPTLTGMRQIEPELLDVMRSLNAKESQIFVKVRVPNSIPYIFSGFKLGISLSIIGAVIGEFISAQEGLGYIIMLSQTTVESKIMFSALVLLAILGVGVYAITTLVERRLTAWRPKEELVR